MFSYIAILGFLGFIVYASSFAYAVLQKKEERKKNGVRMVISLVIMIAGIIGLNVT